MFIFTLLQTILLLEQEVPFCCLVVVGVFLTQIRVDWKHIRVRGLSFWKNGPFLYRYRFDQDTTPAMLFYKFIFFKKTAITQVFGVQFFVATI